MAYIGDLVTRGLGYKENILSTEVQGSSQDAQSLGDMVMRQRIQMMRDWDIKVAVEPAAE